jgi:REP element-mobilizing transposase RayT
MKYLITFTTYGTWLHGDSRRSVDKGHNQLGSDFVTPASVLNRKEKSTLKNPPVTLERNQRDIVLQAILDVCQFRGWFAHAVHVRSNHVHVVVSGEEKPEKMMVDFKIYASRAIRRSNSSEPEFKKYWTRHGSTKYIWTKESLESVLRYVKREQGKMMSYGQSHERQ